MTHDFFGEFAATTVQELDALAKRSGQMHPSATMQALAQTTATRESKLPGLAMYQQLVDSAAYQKSLMEGRQLLEKLGAGPPEMPDWDRLPDFSFFVRIDFRLATAYLGRDDRAFAVTENPVRKDRVFSVPFISATTWKGALRHACAMTGAENERRIFGPRKEEEEADRAFRGRLYPYPSFFTRVGFEMINPHDRETRTGKNPIRMECVPAGSESRLALLYAPISDAEEGWTSEPWTESAEDLATVARTAVACLTSLGFSAKRTSGFGSAETKLTGKKGFVGIKRSGIVSRTFDDLAQLEEAALEVGSAIRGLV